MKLLIVVSSAVVLLLPGCIVAPPPPVVVTDEAQTLNPSGIAPLTALLEMTTDAPVRAAVEVLAKNEGGG